MTPTEAQMGIHYRINPPCTWRAVRAIRHKYRVYDLQHPVRWYARLWAALVIAWWIVKGMVKS